MDLVIKEIIKSLRENWQEWEYSIEKNSEYKLIHKLVHKKTEIGMFTGTRDNCSEDKNTAFCGDSSFRCKLGFFSRRRLLKAMEFCIAKIIAKKLEPEHGTIVEKAIRHLDLED